MALQVSENLPLWRIAVAVLLVPLIASFVFAFGILILGGIKTAADGIVVAAISTATVYAYPVTFLLGAPAILILNGWIANRMSNWVLGGVIIASAPVGIFLMLYILHQVANPEDASLSDLFDTFLFAGYTAAVGGFAGSLFWVVTTVKLPLCKRKERVAKG